jgi:hypothetical protein
MTTLGVQQRMKANTMSTVIRNVRAFARLK